MIFLALYEAAKKKELILIDGGLCHYHYRKDGQITIGEIISTRPGAGREMLQSLKDIAAEKKAWCIFAKCPTTLEANVWYKKRGFTHEGQESLKSGSTVELWRLILRKRKQFSGFFED